MKATITRLMGMIGVGKKTAYFIPRQIATGRYRTLPDGSVRRIAGNDPSP
jgi:endonuclease III